MNTSLKQTTIQTAAGSRIEADLLGEIAVPQQALYGAQTQRAVVSLPVPDRRTIDTYPTLIEGLLCVKEAAAATNRAGEFLSRVAADAIMAAVHRLRQGDYVDQFLVHRLHGGGGTSANMNVNEVLANVAEESLGGRRGEYKLVHPNDHVNLHQSTNDVYPTACHVAVLRQWPTLQSALTTLSGAFRAKATEYRGQLRLARSCLQDAVERTYHELFTAYANCLTRIHTRLEERVDALHAVNLGGTIVGRSSDVPPAYLTQIIPSLRVVTGDEAMTSVKDLFDAAQNVDDLVAVSSELDFLARTLIKIAKDLRLLASGPEAGFGEIQLPAVQPGSSIMPGKVNPVIPEFVIQSCFQVLGHHVSCEAAVDHGELDVNIWESTVVFNILDAMELLANAMTTFEARCVSGIRVSVERNSRNVDTLMPLLTRLTKQFSYSHLSELCKRADGDLTKLRELLRHHIAP